MTDHLGLRDPGRRAVPGPQPPAVVRRRCRDLDRAAAARGQYPGRADVRFDPTPIAGRVPDNVGVFINLYQKTNLIGGGEAVGANGFRGRIVNVDLRERREIIHITLDKSPVLHALVADKIVAILRPPAAAGAAAACARPHQRARCAGRLIVTPLSMRYVVPPMFRSCCGTARSARRRAGRNAGGVCGAHGLRRPGRSRASTMSVPQIRRRRVRRCWCRAAPTMRGLRYDHARLSDTVTAGPDLMV